MVSTRVRAVVASLLLAAAVPTAAQPIVRSPGTVFYRCHATHHFTLPGAFGGPVRLSRGPRGQLPFVEEPATVEHISAALDVEEDGRTSRLALTWVQDGFWGFDERRRADLNVFMAARFGAAIPWGRLEMERFDPVGLQIELKLNALSRIRSRAFIRLRRDGDNGIFMSLGGPATVPNHRPTSASVYVLWRDLASFAGDEDRMVMDVSRTGLSYGADIASAMFDLSIMPSVLQHFEAAEAQVRALAADARSRCSREVEPEPAEDAEI